jgi:glutamine---fructose-6-phosphate transaminase (isomerizing)
MCGLVGVLGVSHAWPRTLEALKALQYRGYDASGIAMMKRHNQHIFCVRVTGSVDDLAQAVTMVNWTQPENSVLAIGHTRWASHGVAVERNAHPHKSGPVALVLNGIVSNHEHLRQHMPHHVFASDTDAEVAAHWLHDAINDGLSLPHACLRIGNALSGIYTLIAISAFAPESMAIVCRGNALWIGRSPEGYCVSSDPMALQDGITHVAMMANDTVAYLTLTSISYWAQGHEQPLLWEEFTPSSSVSTHSGFSTFMEKEMHEQLHLALDPLWPSIVSNQAWCFLGCGSSYHAACVGQMVFTDVAHRWVDVCIASDRGALHHKPDVLLALSQSGETLDTREGLKCLKKHYPQATTVALVNVVNSILAREVDTVIPLNVGPEIGVAATKTFTAQLRTFIAWAHHLADVPLVDTRIPSEWFIALSDVTRSLVSDVSQARMVLFVAKAWLLPIALEGALKFQELTYLPAYGVSSGELKHGPIALIDSSVFSVILAPSGPLLMAQKNVVQSIVARQGKCIVLTDVPDEFLSMGIWACVPMPQAVSKWQEVIWYTLPLQYMAYWTSLARGLNVDRPRHLAKAITVV